MLTKRLYFVEIQVLDIEFSMHCVLYCKLQYQYNENASFSFIFSILPGYKVSDTIRKGIVDPDVYQGNPKEFMLGNLSALGNYTFLIIIICLVPSTFPNGILPQAETREVQVDLGILIN